MTADDLSSGDIVALDPGGTTGVAVYDMKTKEFIDIFQITNEHHLVLFERLRGIEPRLIVCERFDYRQYAGRKEKVDLSAREYIGVAKLYAQMYNLPSMVMQSPLKHDKGLWTDKKLKQCGLLVEPASTYPHANDALRHMLFFLTTNKEYAPQLSKHKTYWLRKVKP